MFGWWVQAKGPGAENSNWIYHDKIFSEIRNEGLDIVPILSTHQCGFNVGDFGRSIPLPQFFLDKMKASPEHPDLAYISEAGNRSEEAASHWGWPWVKDDVTEFWKSFRDHYKEKPEIFKAFNKIIIGTGPAGEAINPAYHSSDWSKQVKHAEVPNRGALQASSELAQADSEPQCGPSIQKSKP